LSIWTQSHTSGHINYSKLIDITHAVIIVRHTLALSTTHRLFDCHSWWLVYITVHRNIVFVYLFKWIISLILFSLILNIFLTSFFGKLFYYWSGYLPWFIWKLKPFSLLYIANDATQTITMKNVLIFLLIIFIHWYICNIIKKKM